MSAWERLVQQGDGIVVTFLRTDADSQIEESRLRDKSEKFLKESYFLELLEEIAEIKRGRIISDVDEDFIINSRPNWLFADNSSFSSVLWEEKQVATGEYQAKGLSVEALPNGTIIIIGAFGGSTVLLDKDWRNNKKVQLDALSKASKNPLSIQYIVEKEGIDFSTNETLLF